MRCNKCGYDDHGTGLQDAIDADISKDGKKP